MPHDKLQELVNEIVALEGDWEEMSVSHSDMGYSASVNCADICWLAEQVDRGAVIKLFRKRK